MPGSARSKENLTDDVSGDLIKIANWSTLKIAPVPQATYIFLCSYMVIITLFALSLNGAVIGAFCKIKVSSKFFDSLNGLTHFKLKKAVNCSPNFQMNSARTQHYV